MRVPFMAHIAAFVLTAMPLAAYQQAAQQAAPQGPHPKSQKEVDALKQVQAAAQASNYDAEIAAINNVLENFADTDYKPMLLSMAMDAAQRKGDYPQTVVWGERIIQNDPKDFSARILLAADIAQHTRENDLDKDQSLKKVDDYAHQGLDLLKTASDTPPVGFNGTAADYAAFKKDQAGLAEAAIGQADELRKKYPEAIEQYKTALNDAAHPNSTTLAFLSRAYVENKQYDDAIATADKVLAMSDAPSQVKQFAQAQKDNATKLKAAASK
ncbi:MAG: hypothetical protein JO097_13670 [Acidobacteriaceae bacterium]|nr:hypothetical protein [Acidobacteriaceae bacterium]MBV9295238.1 hypothetical protein [Acidobacteriaceae bacterium]MBV9767452.1 hypothetical protein [Acidobacteriaceae bacterium]